MIFSFFSWKIITLNSKASNKPKRKRKEDLKNLCLEYTEAPIGWYDLYEAVYKIGMALFIPLFLASLIVGIPYLLYDFLNFFLKEKINEKIIIYS